MGNDAGSGCRYIKLRVSWLRSVLNFFTLHISCLSCLSCHKVFRQDRQDFQDFLFVHFEFPEEIQNSKSLREGGVVFLIGYPVYPVDPVRKFPSGSHTEIKLGYT